MRISLLLAASFVLSSGLGSRALGVPFQYDVVDLGALPGVATSRADAIDPLGSGLVAGRSPQIYGAGPKPHAFVWTAGGGLQDLGTFGGLTSEAHAVSGGTVVGDAQLSGNLQTHAFVWTAATGLRDIGTVGGRDNSFALGVDAAGEVVGYSVFNNFPDGRAFLWTEAGGMVDLGTLGGTMGRIAWAVESGTVVGESYIAGDTGDHAFIWTAATGMRDLGTLAGGQNSAALAIDGTDIVGLSWLSGDPHARQHAVLWTGGSIQDLGTFYGDSTAYAVNQGRIVGDSHVASGADHAFIWTAATGMVDVNPAGWTSSVATGIDAGGNIVGYGTNALGEQHAFLLTSAELPVPEPASLAVAAAGALAVAGSGAGARRRRR